MRLPILDYDALPDWCLRDFLLVLCTGAEAYQFKHLLCDMNCAGYCECCADWFLCVWSGDSVTGWIAIVIMGIGIFILNLFGDVKEDAESEGEQK